MSDSSSNYFGVEIPFAAHCGIIALTGEPGIARLKVGLKDHHQNNIGIAHGGIILTLLDIALGSAARLSVEASVMTNDKQTAFLSPGRGELFGEGRVVRPGRSLIFCEGDVRDAQGVLVAKASGLFKPARVRDGA